METAFQSASKSQQLLEIATLTTVTDKKRKNIQITWGDLVTRFMNTIRTNETEDEYQYMAKANKDKIKDVGGFVGGRLKFGSRKAENVQTRQIITLDVDFPTGDVWGRVTKVLSCEALMYSTHSHRIDNERYRIIIPINRPCLPDEYQAIARMVASKIGIDIFDTTTYQPNRIMYWPSTPKDGEFVFKRQEGVFLNADEILGLYDNYADVTEWPTSMRETKHIKSALKKREDPLKKNNIVGLFCRTYSVTEAIETFLSSVYEPTLHEDRFTYIEGTTAAGAVIYDDKFVYSNHSTDPASEQLCNAFDIVRIHKFGYLDEDTSTTRVTKLPSFKAMTDWVTQDEMVKLTKAKENERFVSMFDDEEKANKPWRTRLALDSNDRYLPTAKNIMIILENDEALKGKMKHDEFADKDVVVGTLPWSKNTERDWSDADDAGLRYYFEDKYGIVSRPKIADALSLLFERQTFNPVKDYLEAQKWDKVRRVDRILIDYLGAEDTPYNRIVIRKALVAAVARIFNPGCKFDNMLILSGPQGIGKSSLFRILGKDWYSDTIITVQGKEAYEQLKGVWLAEMAELTATKKADIESIKLFISKQEDHFRAAYERRAKTMKRKCILVGTTNDKEVLRDRTGNRRFWPVAVGVEKPKKNIFEQLEIEANQIWAEAVELYKKGETLYLDKKHEKMAKEQQEQFTEESSKAGMIRAYIDTAVPEDWYEKSVYDRRSYFTSDELLGPDVYKSGYFVRDQICTQEIWFELFQGDIKGLKPVEAREIKEILRSTPGWEEQPNPRNFGKPYGRQRWFKRVDIKED